MNENNELNNVEPTVENPVTPEVTEPATPEVTPELTQPEVPATPEVTPAPEAAPAEPAPVEAPAPAPVEAPAPAPVEAAPVTPEVTQPTAPVAEDPAMAVPAEAPKKKVPVLVIIAVVLALAAAAYFLFFNKKEEPVETPVENNTTVAEPTKEEKFLELANKYVAAVQKMWTEDKLVCQNPANTNETLKPSALPKEGTWGEPANYYVFIDTENTTEVKLDVDDKTPVAGWIRVGITDSTYYVALSDGTNYIVDTGTEFGVKSTALTAKDVVTTGNGNNYQYKHGEIFGSQTDGKGWGIGDSKVLSDDDKSNDGIYMSNGLKTGGYTPFCSNIE